VELSEAIIVAEAMLGGFAGSSVTGFRRDKSRRNLFARWTMPSSVQISWRLRVEVRDH